MSKLSDIFSFLFCFGLIMIYLWLQSYNLSGWERWGVVVEKRTMKKTLEQRRQPGLSVTAFTTEPRPSMTFPALPAEWCPLAVSRLSDRCAAEECQSGGRQHLCLWARDNEGKSDPNTRWWIPVYPQTPALGAGDSSVGSGDSSVVRASVSWLKGPGFDSLQERRENFLLQGQLSVLTLISVSVPTPCYRSST